VPCILVHYILDYIHELYALYVNERSMDKGTNKFGRFDYLKISILGFALTGLAGSMNSIILPIRLLDFLEESQKNTFLGLLTFAGLVLAMITQPIIGAISDRSSFKWGRRRPYILIGTILVLLFLPGIGLVGSFTGILLVYCMLQISSNTAQAPYQAFIPDLVPQNIRGRASGVKNVLEILGGIALMRLAAFLMERYFGHGEDYWLWMALGALAVVFLVTGLFTVLAVKEQTVTGSPRLPLSTVYKSFKIDLKHHGFGWFLAARAVLGIPGVVLQIFALYYLMDYIGIANPAAAAGDLLVVVGVCLLAMVYPAGRLSDKIGRKPVVVFSGFLGALGVVSLFFSQNYTSIMLSGALLGIANGILLSSSWALATDLAPIGEEARYLGVTNLAMAGGSALARLIGPAIDFFNNIHSGLGYQVMLLVCFISFVVGALLIIKVKQNEPRQPRGK